MRTLKFRIWNPSGQNMLYDIDNVFECLKQQIKFDGTMPDRGFIPAYNHKGEGMVWMQFTGFLDKNGKEIYEGDILKGGIYLEYPVEWDFEDNGWNIKNEYNIRKNFEIIGNIHQNTELLK